MQCVKYARITTRVPLPLPIGCLLTVFSLSLLMSVIHSAETESWLLNVIALFRLESIFCCFACCERFSTPGQLFLIILFHFGCLPQRTSPHSSSLYMEIYNLSLVTPHPPPPPTLLLELRHEADATHHRPLDLYGPLFSPCTVKGCERGPTCCRV